MGREEEVAQADFRGQNQDHGVRGEFGESQSMRCGREEDAPSGVGIEARRGSRREFAGVCEAACEDGWWLHEKASMCGCGCCHESLRCGSLVCECSAVNG